MKRNIIILLLGIFFGLMLTKAEIVSWYRLQEMFRLQSFHMFGFLGSVVGVSALSLFLIRRFDIKNVDGDSIHLIPLRFHYGNVFGGILFGMGWSMVGACPGPMFALFASGWFWHIFAILGATLGTFAYGVMRDKLPH